MEKNKKYVVGIDIGGTKCAITLGKGEIPTAYDCNFIIEKAVFSTKSEPGWQQVIAEIMHKIDDVLDNHRISLNQIIGIGISCGGPLDYKTGVIMNPPNLIGWDDVHIVQILKEQYHVPVYLQNDANACALAEWKFGAARDTENAIFLTFGTGMGAGLILDNRLYHGKNDMAGEVGHIRLSENGPVGYGKAGSLEGFCSGGGIAQLAQTILLEHLQKGESPALLADVDLADITAKDIGIAADKGDVIAKEILQISGEYLGKGLSLLVDILNPEVIVIGSIFERCEEYLRPAMQEQLNKEGLKYSTNVCRVLPAALKDEIGDYAALTVAFGY